MAGDPSGSERQRREGLHRHCDHRPAELVGGRVRMAAAWHGPARWRRDRSRTGGLTSAGQLSGETREGPARQADYVRLIVVAFPLTSALRSSAYAGQMNADCCGGFPSLAADLPAVVFGMGLP